MSTMHPLVRLSLQRATSRLMVSAVLALLAWCQRIFITPSPNAGSYMFLAFSAMWLIAGLYYTYKAWDWHRKLRRPK
jgi:hypothetical protein